MAKRSADSGRHPSQIDNGGKATSLWTNLRWGARTGFGLALLFCAWIVVLMVLNAGFTLHMSGGHSVNGLGVIVLYLLIGTIGGTIVGSLRRFAGTRVGAPIVGLLVAFVSFFGLVDSV